MNNYQDDTPSKTIFHFLPNLKDAYNLKNLSEKNTKKYSLDGPYFINNMPKMTDGGFLRKYPMIAEVDNARILGDSNVILNEDSNACIESIVFNPKVNNKIFGSNYLDHFLLEDEVNTFVASKNNYFNEAIFIGSSWNFGHWIHNHLARLIYFDEAKIELPIVINANTPKNYIESLKLLGFKEKNIIYLKAGEVNFFNKLLVPTMPWHFDHTEGMWWTPNSFSTLRNYFSIDHHAENKELKIFISRKDTTHRRLENEDKIFNELKKFGFIRITPSKISIEEQVELAGDASVVISPPGAGAFLFLFMKDSAKFIELIPPGQSLDITGPFAKKCNLNFIKIVGEPLLADANKIQETISPPASWFVENNIDQRYLYDRVEVGQTDFKIDINLILQVLNDA